MRVWLLILAVLATLQLASQVASTGERQQQVLQISKGVTNQTLSSSTLTTTTKPTILASSQLQSPPSFNSLLVIVDPSTSKLSDSLSDHSSIKNTAVKLAVADGVASSTVAPENEGENSLSHHPEQKTTFKPDTDTLVKVQNTLLTAFGLKRPPRKVDRSKILIPETMKQMYAEIIDQDLDSVTIPRPGLNTKTANTVRTFIHQGEFFFLIYINSRLIKKLVLSGIWLLIVNVIVAF